MTGRRPGVRADWHWVLPALAPAVLLAAGNDAFGFDPPGWLDSFVYTGYFWHYPEHLWVFDDNSNYKISRLPWILPGFVLQTLMGTIGGAYALAYLTLAGGAVAAYLLVRDSFDDQRAAAVVGVAWACCTWVHGIGGWSYHGMASGAYYLLACWLLVRAARGRHPRASAVVAGVAFACAVHTHLFLAVFTPFLAVLSWAWQPRTVARPWWTIGGAALLALAGGLALTLALGVINRATGGAWLFFMPQVEQAFKLTQPGYDQWWLGNASEWLPQARYLVIPTMFLVAGLAVALLRRRDLPGRPAVTAVAVAWAALAVMVFFQFVRRQTTLDYSYMAFPLYLHAFPCAGAVLAGWNQDRHRWPLLTIGAAAATILGTLLFLLPAPLPSVMDRLSAVAGIGPWPVVAPFVLGVAGALAMALVKGSARVLVFAAWFAVVNAWVAPHPTAYGIGTPGYRQEMLGLFRDADRFTTDLDPSLIGIKYWLTNEELVTASGVVGTREVFDSFLATRGWFTNLLGRVSPSPPIDQLTTDDFERGACIGILSSAEQQAGLRREMQAHFEGLGLPLTEVASRRFAGADLSFALTVLGPRPAPTGGSGSPRPCTR